MFAAAVAAFFQIGSAFAFAPSEGDIKAALDNAYNKVVNVKEGKNADYIPALAKVELQHLRYRARHRQTAASTPQAM